MSEPAANTGLIPAVSAPTEVAATAEATRLLSTSVELYFRPLDDAWYRETFIPTVQQRGAAIIKARGLSSAASAASSALDHMRTWMHGTADGDWVSMGIPSDGSYGIAEGVMYSYPVTCKDGKYSIVQGLPIDEFSRQHMDATDKELREERDGVKDLL